MEGLSLDLFIQKMRSFRREHRLSQEGFAKGTGYHQKTISAIEAGHKKPSAEGRQRMLFFMEHASEEEIAALRTVGAGRPKGSKGKSRNLPPEAVRRSDVRRMPPEEIDAELTHMGSGFKQESFL